MTRVAHSMYRDVTPVQQGMTAAAGAATSAAVPSADDLYDAEETPTKKDPTPDSAAS